MGLWKGKRAVVVGLGKSGLAAVRFLAREGAQVWGCDQKEAAALGHVPALLASLGAKGSWGIFDEALFLSADVIVLSPGVPRSHPVVARALAAGVAVTNEPALAFERISTPVVAVTGTAGKTTTCSLVAALLQAGGSKVFLGGNIGNPLLNLVMSGERVDAVVAELSSFQLETIAPFRPLVVLYTPIERDHMDRYPSVEAYHAAKHRLLEFSDPSTTLVVKSGNLIHETFAKTAPGPVQWYGYDAPASGRTGAWYDCSREEVVFSDGTTLNLKGLLPGMGNRENVASAALAARAMGAAPESMERALREFKPIAHRMELVREHRGVRFFNDSKSTNVTSALSALSVFSRREVVLILGGRPKGTDFSPLRDEVVRACKRVVLVGEAADALEATLKGLLPLERQSTFDDAVAAAARAAAPGESVVLSPACASQDMFRDYEDRGNTFRRLVLALP